MGLIGTVAAQLLGFLAVLVPSAAALAPSASLVSEARIDPLYDQGLARSPAGWVVSGRNVLARLDERLEIRHSIEAAIPPDWAQRGFDHIGDIDVSGTTLYVPFEQPDYEEDRQAMARYDARTLAFRDAKIVVQHENSFVAVDGASGIAYSMDRFGGAALLRYDIRADWRRLAPLRLDRGLERVQGASVARGAVWLSTDDQMNGLYRVDIKTGKVSELGSAAPVDGEGKGIDASTVLGDDLHATVVAPDHSSVALDHFVVTGVKDAPASPLRSSSGSDTSWPPVLVYFAVGLTIVALGAVGTVFWRAHSTIHPKR